MNALKFAKQKNLHYDNIFLCSKIDYDVFGVSRNEHAYGC